MMKRARGALARIPRFVWIILLLSVYAFVMAVTSALTAFLIIEGPAEFFDDLRMSARALADGDVIGWFSLYFVLPAVVLQGLLLLPLRGPRLEHRPSGWSVWTSLGVAGLFMAAITMGAVWIVGDLLFVRGTMTERLAVEDYGWLISLSCLGVSWIFWTWIMWVFMRRGRSREGAIGRMLGVVFAGSVIEMAAGIPVNVMVRRRVECECDPGSFFALLIAGAAALWTMGPAALLLVLVRRRRITSETACAHCGYLKGPRAERSARCPECGHAWD